MTPTGVASGTTRIVVNGLEIDAVVDPHLLDDLLMPQLVALAANRVGGERTFVFLAAPPGTGKSVLAALLLDRAHHLGLDLDAVGLDGFHHPQSYLESHYLDTAHGRVPLATIKGAPETFDVEGLARQLDAARTHDLVWPAYDRTAHDVVAGQQVSAAMVLVEGNWLLLDEPGWAPLAAHSSFNIFVDADPALLRERLIDRKARGGLSREAAEEFYERSDRVNAERVLTHTDRSRVDLLLHLQADGTIQQGGSQ